MSHLVGTHLRNAQTNSDPLKRNSHLNIMAIDPVGSILWRKPLDVSPSLPFVAGTFLWQSIYRDRVNIRVIFLLGQAQLKWRQL